MTGTSSAQDQWADYVQETSGKIKRRYRLAYGLFAVGALLFIGAIGAEFEVWSVPFLPLLIPGLALIAVAAILLVLVASSLNTKLLKEAVAETLGGRALDMAFDTKPAIEPLMEAGGALSADAWYKIPGKNGDVTVATVKIVKHQGDIQKEVLEGVYITTDPEASYSEKDTFTVFKSDGTALHPARKQIPKADPGGFPAGMEDRLTSEDGVFGALKGSRASFFATRKGGIYSASTFRSAPRDLPEKIGQSIRDAVALIS